MRRVTRAADAGFTLVELVASMFIATLTLGVTVSLVIDSQSAAGRVTDRMDAGQRGRVAMEQMTQPLRSQVCLQVRDAVQPNVTTFRPAIADGTDTKVTFYTELTGTVPFVPERREFEWSADGRIVERRWVGTNTPPNTTFAATPAVREVAQDTRNVTGQPIFRYFGFVKDPVDGSTDMVALPTPLSEADRARVVQTTITFRVKPTRLGGYDRSAVLMQSSVFARNADPRFPEFGPVCR